MNRFLTCFVYITAEDINKIIENIVELDSEILNSDAFDDDNPIPEYDIRWAYPPKYKLPEPLAFYKDVEALYSIYRFGNIIYLITLDTDLDQNIQDMITVLCDDIDKLKSQKSRHPYKMIAGDIAIML